MQWTRTIITSVAACVFLAALPASAHAPRIVGSASVDVAGPESSQAFYGTLTGTPAVYRIDAANGFDLYVNILTPARTNADGRFSVDVIHRIGERQVNLASLDAGAGEWTPFHEPFGNDEYFKGPEFREHVPAGTYEVVVWNADMSGAYVLAIGEREHWTARDIGQLFVTLPVLKYRFFGWSAQEIILSRIGAAWAVLIALIAGAVVLLVRFARRRAAHEAPDISPT